MEQETRKCLAQMEYGCLWVGTSPQKKKKFQSETDYSQFEVEKPQVI